MSARFVRHVAALALLTACGDAKSSDEAAASVASPILAGRASDASQDAVVLVMRYEGGRAATLGGCTGTLLTPRLVLTARHCVADTDESSVCTSEGKATRGGRIRQNYAPNSLFVFPGTTRPDLLNDGLSRVARGKEIIDDGAETLCNHDIALVLLDRDFPDAPVASVRLAAKPAVGERLTAVGWGFTEATPEPETRQQREDVGVLTVGPDAPSGLGSAEFLTGEAGCQGDSGGPLFAESGAVVGILSRGGNGTKAPPPESCANAHNVYVATAGFRDLILAAAERAGDGVWAEGESVPQQPMSVQSDSGCRVSRLGAEGRSSWFGLALVAAALGGRLVRRGRTG